MEQIARLMVILALIWAQLGFASLKVGIGKAGLTPPVGTPSAGYTDRKGAGMEGVHDPLLALALVLDNGTKQLALCSVDHLGFSHEMVEKVRQKVQAEGQTCEIFIASSHTHSGGGAYLNVPVVGESLAGAYNTEITKFYVEQTARAILQACQQKKEAKMGIGYGEAKGLSEYRTSWPKEVSPLEDLTVIKITHLDDTPLAVLFNYPVHPTVLGGENRLFSADFVGYARRHLESVLGNGVQPLYFNGAQGDIAPAIFNEQDRFDACASLGSKLADQVKLVWEGTATADTVDWAIERENYSFKPQANPFGIVPPVEVYETEISAIVFNHSDAFIAVPGEMSCVYDQRLKEKGKELGFAHVSIFGLTNDAHGYIILPEAWRHKTMESGLCFGGEEYGDWVEKKAETLLKQQERCLEN